MFDGPGTKYNDVDKKITPDGFVRSKQNERVDKNVILDAFFEACFDLLAEGFIAIKDGVMELCDRPLPSDRSVDAVGDHGEQKVEEVGISDLGGAELSGPRLVAITDLPKAIVPFVRQEDFGSHVISYDRVIVVENERRAITYSAVRPFVESAKVTNMHLATMKNEGIFKALARYGFAPTLRRERLMCRFPNNEERVHLGMDYALTRIPVIVALGSVFSKDLLVEKYVNIMRADRYIIDSEISLRPAHDCVDCV